MTNDEAGSAQIEPPTRGLHPKGSTIRNKTVRLGVIVAVLAAAMSLAPSAMAAPAANKDLCKNGGYANYVDPATGQPFKNQGQCVSFVNGGGVLVEPIRVDLEPQGDAVLITITGLEPRLYHQVRLRGADGEILYGQWRYADANGTSVTTRYRNSYPCERFPATVEVYSNGGVLGVSEETFLPESCQA